MPTTSARRGRRYSRHAGSRTDRRTAAAQRPPPQSRPPMCTSRASAVYRPAGCGCSRFRRGLVPGRPAVEHPSNLVTEWFRSVDELLLAAYRALTGKDADRYSRKDPRWKEPAGARAVCA
jgi:hypothetical protein